jgi:hypothetical protein
MDGSRIKWLIRVGLATMLLAAAGILADPGSRPSGGSHGGAIALNRFA